MSRLIDIINEEILSTAANFPRFGDRLKSISETGEGTAESYPFTYHNISDNQIEYHFDTVEEAYIVSFAMAAQGDWYMEFGVAGGMPQDIINKGELFKVMSTVLKIVNDFLDRHQPDTLRFEPSKDEERDDDNRRFNLYMQYIKKNMRKDYYVEPRGDWILIKRKLPIN